MSFSKKALYFKFALFLGLFNFEWHHQNKVGNIGIRVLWKDPEILYCVILLWVFTLPCTFYIDFVFTLINITVILFFQS